MAMIDSTLSVDGILRMPATYSSEVSDSLCILSLTCIQQLLRPIDSAARNINVEAIELSSTHTSHLSGSAHTTIPKGAFFRNWDPCIFAFESLL